MNTGHHWSLAEIGDLRRLSKEEFLSRYPVISPTAYRQRRHIVSNDVMASLPATGESVLRERPTHPTGWEPGMKWDGRKGEITAQLDHPDPKWDSLLDQWGFDHNLFSVVEPVQFRVTDVADGKRYYYRAAIVSRQSSPGDNIDGLIAEIGAIEPAPFSPPSGNLALVVALSDLQLGKAGTAETVQRIVDMIGAVETRVKELRAIGREIGAIYGLGMGDLVEGCSEHYPMETFEVELDRREQVKLARRLVVLAAQRWSPLVERLVMAAVGGNHGEHRKDGKAFTTFGDNDDVAVFEQAAEIIGANSAAYPNVSWVIPDQDLTLTLDIMGTIVGIAHGHQAFGAGTPQVKISRWWQAQSHGMRPVGDASILVTGHFHQFGIHQDGPRTHMQAPTLDSGSRWFAEQSGMNSVAGTLTFVVGPTGWQDVQVIR